MGILTVRKDRRTGLWHWVCRGAQPFAADSPSGFRTQLQALQSGLQHLRHEHGIKA